MAYNKEAKRKYYQENKDKIKKRRKKYYLENINRIKRYRRKNREKLRLQNRLWRKRNPKAIKNRRLQIQLNVIEYLKSHPCVDCDNLDIRVLEFDHIKGKKYNHLSVLINERYSWKTIQKEITKCVVRCANCHRIKTCERQNSMKQRVINGEIFSIVR